MECDRSDRGEGLLGSSGYAWTGLMWSGRRMECWIRNIVRPHGRLLRPTLGVSGVIPEWSKIDAILHQLNKCLFSRGISEIR